MILHTNLVLDIKIAGAVMDSFTSKSVYRLIFSTYGLHMYICNVIISIRAVKNKFVISYKEISLK